MATPRGERLAGVVRLTMLRREEVHGMHDQKEQHPCRTLRLVPLGVGLAIAVVLVFFAIRVATDWPLIIDGTSTSNGFAQRYVAHPVLSYAHLVPGVLYLLGAPLQLTARFRRRHYAVHRRMGTVLVVAGLLSGLFVFLFGARYPYGGSTEALAAIVFGNWFLVCLVLGYRAIRRGVVPQHRRWMIRAFAVGTGVGMIRLWVGLFVTVQQATGGTQPPPIPEPVTFGIAFWLGLTIHVLIGEWWLRVTPALNG